MNTHDSKYFNTARVMNEAMVSLLAEKEFEFITVKELCNRAGVNRSTFYLHYETISDLLKETMEYTVNDFSNRRSVCREHILCIVEPALTCFELFL